MISENYYMYIYIRRNSTSSKIANARINNKTNSGIPLWSLPKGMPDFYGQHESISLIKEPFRCGTRSYVRPMTISNSKYHNKMTFMTLKGAERKCAII